MPFARFLKEHAAVEPGQAREYVHWVDRYLASGRPAKGESTSQAVARFMDRLGREEPPEHLPDAGEAVRLYAFFQGRERTEPAPRTASTAAVEWNRLADEMTRIARLLHAEPVGRPVAAGRSIRAL